MFMDTVSIDPAVAEKVTQTINQSGNVITITYEYEGAQFVLEAEVDAVQTHNVEAAVKSAWGVDVTKANDGTLTYK